MSEEQFSSKIEKNEIVPNPIISKDEISGRIIVTRGQLLNVVSQFEAFLDFELKSGTQNNKARDAAEQRNKILVRLLKQGKIGNKKEFLNAVLRDNLTEPRAEAYWKYLEAIRDDFVRWVALGKERYEALKKEENSEVEGEVFF